MSVLIMRSKLFVPGSRPELFAKAMAGEADALSIDLEDAVDESRKAEARAAVGEFLRSLPADKTKTIIVRVNGIATEHFEADVEAIAGPGLDLINVPMTETGDDVRKAAAVITRIEKAKGLAKPIGILANVETAKGISVSPRSSRLRISASPACSSASAICSSPWGSTATIRRSCSSFSSACVSPLARRASSPTTPLSPT